MQRRSHAKTELTAEMVDVLSRKGAKALRGLRMFEGENPEVVSVDPFLEACLVT